MGEFFSNAQITLFFYITPLLYKSKCRPFHLNWEEFIGRIQISKLFPKFNNLCPEFAK